MTETLEPDICVIGAGPGGLTVAAGAAQMGARVVLVERGAMGGDCLNHGCVPSKSLIAAARAARAMRQADRFGVIADEPIVEFARVHAHIHGVIAEIAPHDSVERFEELGVNVIREAGQFVDGRTLAAGDARVRARRFVIATGAAPAVPPIPGLDEVAYHTNLSIFALDRLPRRLVVIGGGPVGAELAQAYAQLGAAVTLVEAERLLGREDPELVEFIGLALRRDGVRLEEGAAVAEIAARGDDVALRLERDGKSAWIEGSDLLVAVGRRPAIDGLGLEAAGIAHTPSGITVDARLRTTNRRIFAIGDVAGGPQFTHLAAHQAGIVLRNALFRLPARAERRAVPRATFTTPELAHIGLTEEEARDAYGTVRVWRAPFAENDRARCDRETDGLVKLVADRRGRVLGAGIVGAGAGDLIAAWAGPVARRARLAAMASAILPYPTFAEAGKRAAASAFEPLLFGERTRWLVRLLGRLP